MLAAAMGLITFGYACLYSGIERFRGNPTSVIASLGGKGGSVTQANLSNSGSGSTGSSGGSGGTGSGGGSTTDGPNNPIPGGSANFNGTTMQGTMSV